MAEQAEQDAILGQFMNLTRAGPEDVSSVSSEALLDLLFIPFPPAFLFISGSPPSTQANNYSQARQYLDMYNWDLSEAGAAYFAAAEGGDANSPPSITSSPNAAPISGGTGPAPTEPPPGMVRTLAGDFVPAPTPSSGQSARTGRRAAPPAQRGGIRTLGDLGRAAGPHAGHGHGPGHGHDDDDDDDDYSDDENPNMFAGGEKSGLAVQNPNAGASGGGPSSGTRGGRGLISDILKRAAEYATPYHNTVREC